MRQNGRPAAARHGPVFVGTGRSVGGRVASRCDAGGPTFRACDKHTGEVVGELTLPGDPTGAAMSAFSTAGSRRSRRRVNLTVRVFDTHAIARTLTAAGLTPAQVDAITDAVREAADHGDYATQADLVALELRLIKWIVGTGVAVAAVVIGALRLMT
ncbi:MAG: hypothetical protein OXF93_16060 [Acidobacteria bacterium]|nr:hypothetical protein [Acidobacteriota bacterium]